MYFKVLSSLLFLALATSNSFAAVRKAPHISKEKPTLLQADRFDYDDEKEVVTATGNVFINQDRRLLSADKVRYFKIPDLVIAEGNVWIRDEQGNFSFTPYLEVQNRMDDGFVKDIKVLMSDDSKAAANMAKRYMGKKIVMWQGVYSPCKVCKAHPETPPLWQLKSDKLIHDQESQTITHNHTWLEFMGVPIAYFPYFVHPDPLVKRKTGLLMPSYGSSNDLGMNLTLPIFFVTGQNHDATLYPIFTSKQGTILGLEHRYRFDDGEYITDGSYAGGTSTGVSPQNNPNNLKLPPSHRWHFFFKARYDVNDEHLFTVDIKRASDLTYLRRFPVLPKGYGDPFAAQGTLTSTAAIEQFKQTNYAVVRGYVFQSDAFRTSPYVLPIMDYTYESMPGYFGETWGVDANFLNLFRRQAIPMRVGKYMLRGSLGTSFQVPYVTPLGDIWQLKASLREDLYNIDGFVFQVPQSSSKRSEDRFFPQASLTWRFPFVNDMEWSQWMLEPEAMIVASSKGENAIQIPNEDSPLLILDHTNIFLNNRFYGIDRVDSGFRSVYGFHSRHYFSNGRKFFIFLGQTVRLDHRMVLPPNSGEDKNASNIVSSVLLQPFSWFDARSRLMFNRHNLSIDIAETAGSIKTPWLTISGAHVFYDKRLSISGLGLSQVTWGLTTMKYRDFSVSYAETRNLNTNTSVHLLSRSIVAKHENECLTTSFSVIRTGYRDRDLRPDTKFLLQLDFKNLGSFYPINITGGGGTRSSLPTAPTPAIAPSAPMP